MDKDSTSFCNSGAYTSPGTPDYVDNNGGGFQKGWCSERVPLPNNNSKQRRTSANVLMPLSNGRTLPSKWDDAERWITSPVSGSESCRAIAPHPQRRLKSKSGPLGLTHGDTCFSSYSPGFPLLKGGRTNSIFAGSPLTTGVLVPNGYSFHHGRIDAHAGSSLMFIESPYPDSQDEKIDENTGVVSRRDMATQMSPLDSPESSPMGRLLLSTSPPPISTPVEPDIHLSARVEVRDVQVDKRVTMTKQSKRHKKRVEKNGSSEVKDLALTWNPTIEGEMELSKVQREEARISAWENLQNAKAEAAIRKLEMKLEKKKSESMDKIMKKLKTAQMKAQEMRKTMSANQAPRVKHKVMFLHRYPKISLTCCFVPNTIESVKSQVED
ncbi:hypothetical protein L1987_36715 [Smallanthus sonchifolius]|uniref:Uncharacterized protein n=1 Tax=Smallanthus sonchifolius TaxID=185202 RepID=A0ACB9HEC2_9ASTR|nr:hypothetical protein L1987_36715 [Smallanthus sonchifolius]